MTEIGATNNFIVTPPPEGQQTAAHANYHSLKTYVPNKFSQQQKLSSKKMGLKNGGFSKNLEPLKSFGLFQN